MTPLCHPELVSGSQLDSIRFRNKFGMTMSCTLKKLPETSCDLRVAS